MEILNKSFWVKTYKDNNNNKEILTNFYKQKPNKTYNGNYNIFTILNVPIEGFKIFTQVKYKKKERDFVMKISENNNENYIIDPRGFLFKISNDNLKEILKYCCILQNNIKGSLIYIVIENELFLIPEKSLIYKNRKMMEKALGLENFIKTEELNIGSSYFTKDRNIYTFVKKIEDGVNKGFYFYNFNNDSYLKLKNVEQLFVGIHKNKSSLFEEKKNLLNNF